MTILKRNTNRCNINYDIFKKLKILSNRKENKFTEPALINNLVHKNNQLYNNNFRWFKYFLLKKPVNLLFSLDQFIFEFSKKQLQKRQSSEFQQQLKEQKKIKLFYGNLSKKELTKIFEKTKQPQGYFYRNFFCLIERRLDIVLYRSGFAKTIYLARQLITHKKILINNRIITIPGYLIKSGDCISIHPNYLDSLSNNLLLNYKNSLRKTNLDLKFSNLETQNIFKKIHNIKDNKKYYKTLNLFIYLLLEKINNRAHIKIKKNYLTLIKYKPLISKPSKYLLFYLKDNKFLFSEKKPFFSNSKNFLILKEKLRKLINKQEYKNKKYIFLRTQNLKFEKKNKFTSKQNIILNKNLILKILVFMNSKILFRNYLNSEIKKHFLKKRFSFQNIKFSKIVGLKPLHLEISYKLLKIIFLYSPQRLNFPFYINVDLLSRAFK